MEKTNEPRKRSDMIYDDKEQSLFKSTFFNNEALLRVIQKVFFLSHLDDADRETLKQIQKPDLVALVSKVMKPVINHNIPLGQQVDFWTLTKVVDGSVEGSVFELKKVAGIVSYLDKGIARLSDPDLHTTYDITNFQPTGNEVDDAIRLSARNSIIRHVDTQLLVMKAMSEKKDEDAETQQDKKKKNSTK